MSNLEGVTLYEYWRSSASWRVRWALAIKKIPFTSIPVDLAKEENRKDYFLRVNPAGGVPVLKLGDTFLSESIAIMEYLEESIPTPALLPASPLQRALVRELSLYIAAGIHPLQNRAPRVYFSKDQDGQKQWCAHWIARGLEVMEKLLLPVRGNFCVGDTLTMADLCLVPQVYNAIRWEAGIENFPICREIYERCLKLPECSRTSPEIWKGTAAD